MTDETVSVQEPSVTLRLAGVFPHQKEFLSSTKRYAIVAAGTKSGKTAAGAMFAVRELMNTPGCRGEWIAPTYGQSVDIGMAMVLQLIPPELRTVRLSGVPRVELTNGSTIEFRSADTPDNLYGSSFNSVVVDEAGRIVEDAWNAIRSTVTATGGRVRMLSNPCARSGWFYSLYLRGLAEDSDVESFRWRTDMNPLIPASEIEDAQRNLSEATFRSLYCGEFLDVGSSIFRNIRAAASGALGPPEPGREYVAGVDLARTVDWTVMTVIDVASRDVVEWARWHQTGWEMSVGRIFEIAKRYNGCLVHVDSTGLGDVAVEMLERAGVRVKGYKFTNTSKAQLVEHLAALIEKGLLKFPPIDVLIGELEGFEGTTGPSGVVKYGAGAGMHDDAVISLGLAALDLEIGESRKWHGAEFVAFKRQPREEFFTPRLWHPRRIF